MVAVFNKEVLSWYLITLKLQETVAANLPKSRPSTPRPSPAAPLLTQNGEPSSSADQPGDQQSPPPPPPLQSPEPPEPDWVIAIRDNLEQARKHEVASPWSKLSIYRFPKSLRDGDEKAYVPQSVSIGPFHHGQRRLRHMQPHKWRALHHALRRTGHDVAAYLDALRPLEDRVRECYEGSIPLPSHDLLQLLVLDGVFALELFRGAAAPPDGFEKLGYSRHDPVFAMRGTMHAVQRDMIMLENQIPLFVLGRLLGLQLGHGPATDMISQVARLVLHFFDPLMPTDEPLRKADRTRLESAATSVNGPAAAAAFDPLSEKGLHCLDVFRRSLLRTGSQPAPPRPKLKRWSLMRRVADKRRQQLIHCVTELREAGIRCRRHYTDRFWDIKFDNGVLQIPRILIHDGTKSLFLNLIAFEQCQLESTNLITSYVIFMDNLINTGEDVKHLHDEGIIEHWLGNDGEVADLFNRLCLEVVFDMNDSYLSGLSEQVNRYCDHKWNAWRASLTRNYFSNPWAFISLVAAVVLLALTTAQTFYAVYGYYKPPT